MLAIVTGQGQGKADTPAATARTGTFPVSLAEAYAAQFGEVYLTFSPAESGLRARLLTRYLAHDASSDPQLGWNGAGTEYVDSEQVAGISVTSSRSAVVTLLATVNGGRMLELAVPIYSAGGGISVSAPPALMPGPPKADPTTPSPVSSDQATAAALKSQLVGFFAAYASGDRAVLARFAAPGAHFRGLDGAVSFGAIVAVYAPPGGTTRTVAVTVTWNLPLADGSVGSVVSTPASLRMAYQLTVVKHGSSWDVRTIGALGDLRQPQLGQGPP